MKLLVETAGQFQFLDDETGNVIRHDGYTVVPQTNLVAKFSLLGQLKLIAQLNDDATDAEWRAYVKECEGDLTLAVESFRSRFPLPGTDVEKKRGK